MSKAEQSIAEDVTEIDDDEATDDRPDPKTFDVGAMVAGVRATRMRVQVQPNAHLLTRLQELAEEIDSYASDDDVPDELIEEWVETRADFDHVDTYVIEARSSDWIKNHAREAKAAGINPQRKGMSDAEKIEHTRRLALSQIAAQIVEPEGVTEADVAAIFAGNEAEGDKLWRAMNQVNTQPVKALVPDFSQRVSRLSRRG
jgi:hypothetical protein